MNSIGYQTRCWILRSLVAAYGTTQSMVVMSGKFPVKANLCVASDGYI